MVEDLKDVFKPAQLVFYVIYPSFVTERIVPFISLHRVSEYKTTLVSVNPGFDQSCIKSKDICRRI